MTPLTGRRALRVRPSTHTDGPERARAPECRLPVAHQQRCCCAVQSGILTNGPPDTGWLPHLPTLGKYAAQIADSGDTPNRSVNVTWRKYGPERPLHRAPRRSGTEATLALRVRPDGAEEVDAAEVGPV